MATLRKRGDKWHVQVRRRGHATLTKSFTRKADADAWARQQEVALETGSVAAQAVRPATVRLADLLSRYEREVSSRKKGSSSESYRLRAMMADSIAATPLDKLTTARLADYRDDRLTKVGPSSIRRELAILAHCLEVARREWGLGLTVNPMAELRLPSAAPNRERRVTPEEVQRLALALRKCRNKLLVSVVNLAIHTGMRRSELLGLTWRNVDLKRGLAFLPDTKNGHSRHVPLSPAAREVLTELDQGGPADRVLPMSANAVRLSWERLKRRAKVEGLHFHDLRHEAISRFFEAGLSVPEVSLISGHRDPRMLLRYTHLRPEAVAQRFATVASVGVSTANSVGMA